MRRPVLAIAVLTFATLLAACAHEHEALYGNWTAEDAEARRHTLSFQNRSRALWVIEGDEKTENFEIRYVYDDDTTPHKLDLTGFDRGGLKGQTLYCILEWSGAEAFRMDCKPGAPSEEGESVRPADFGEHALLYMKVTR